MRMIRSMMQKLRSVYANSSNDRKIAYLRQHGCHLGQDVKLNCGIKAFNTEPYLITLGDHVLVADDVHFIPHDGAVFVLKKLNKLERQMDKIAPICVGNNVYIGTGAYILPGVKIGNNCIIGAGAVVTKDIPDHSVAAGVPARVIETVEAYAAHCMEKNDLYPTKEMTQKQKRQFYEDLNLRTTYFSKEDP